jgi:plasmid maintenance system antidote protein VapI
MTTQNTSNSAQIKNADKVNDLLDECIKLLHLRNDAALSRAVEVAPPVISKLRHGRLPFGDSIAIRLSELTGISAVELRDRAGAPRYITKNK